MPIDMRCFKYECRIEVFKGETYAPFNYCPGCNQICSPGSWGAPTPAPIAVPVHVKPTPAEIEEAVKEDVTQVLTDIRNTLELRAYDAKKDGESEYARGFFHARNIVDLKSGEYRA